LPSRYKGESYQHRKMNRSYISQIKNELLQSSYSFIFDDILNEYLFNGADFHEVCKAVKNDKHFVFAVDNESEGKRFIAKNSLYDWFVKLNIKLAICKVHTLSERQVLLQMNSLRQSASWNSIPSDYIKFGQDLGLIYCQKEQDKYNFPLSYVMSFFCPSCIQAAREYLLNRRYDEDVSPQFEQLVLERLQDVLKHLTIRQQYVIIRRQGILGSKKMTLEDIGQQLKVTRERIRQIEDKSWKRIWHYLLQQKFVPLLLIYILNRKVSLLISSSNIQRELNFICKCLNIPLYTFPYTNIQSIGYVDTIISLPEDIWIDLSSIESKINLFLVNLPLQLIQEDVVEITEMLVPIVLKSLTKTQKVYLALKQIGRQSHYSEVADMYTNMFPEEYSTENSIHAALLNEKHGVVWIGAKGKFALEEWGYKRPTSNLMDTIASIVEERYRDTGNPVPFVAIQAEIGKYRKFVNPNSLVIASYLNPKLRNVDDFCFLPQEEKRVEKVVDDDRLDNLLRRFEEKTKDE